MQPIAWEALLVQAFPVVANLVYAYGLTMSHFLPQSTATAFDIQTLFIRTYINGQLDSTRLN